MHNYLVIGGSSGIGQAIVGKLSEQGHQVWATYNKNPQTDTQGIHYSHLDVLQDEINLDNLPETLHGIAYCPGSIDLKPFSRLREQQFIDDYRLQVVGATRIIQAVLPKLKSADQASIVLFSSIAAQHGFNFHSLVSASKGAIEGLTRALSAELAPKIRINAIAPALTDTPLSSRLLNTEQKRTHHAEMNPLKKYGAAEDIAEAATFLLTDKASWMTGQVIHVDGGMSVIRK
ncbi:MAG: SDR family oxidoreductase [Bacteroidia bacterium]|nr:SDR family oxidoreductase [Bacteroidia bacterium]